MPETIYDLLRGLVEHTGWRTEQEHKQYVELLNRLEEMATFGDVAARITTKTEVHNVERSDVRQLPEHLQRERPRLAEGDR
jgi:hypothetical protein